MSRAGFVRLTDERTGRTRWLKLSRIIEVYEDEGKTGVVIDSDLRFDIFARESPTEILAAIEQVEGGDTTVKDYSTGEIPHVAALEYARDVLRYQAENHEMLSREVPDEARIQSLRHQQCRAVANWIELLAGER